MIQLASISNFGIKRSISHCRAFSLYIKKTGKPSIAEKEIFSHKNTTFDRSTRQFSINFKNNKSTSDRYLNISRKNIDDIISFEPGSIAFVPVNKHSLAELNENRFTKNIRKEIKTQHLVYGDKNKKYFPLSIIYSLLSINPIESEDAKKFIEGSIFVHASHWIINDLIDTKRNEISLTNQESYAELCINLYLKGLYKEHDDNHPLYEKLEKLSSRSDVASQCKTATKLLMYGLDILFETIQKKNGYRFRSTFEEAIKSFSKKITLTSDKKSLPEYILNRQITSGCIPYMNLGYLFNSIESGVNQESLLDFIEENNKDISEIEKKSNLLNGIINDEFSFHRDIFKENTQNIVTLLSFGVETKNLFNGLLESIKYRKKLYKELKRDFLNLEEKISPNKKIYMQQIKKSILQESYASSSYYLYDDRYKPENKILRTLNNPIYDDNEKFLFFKKTIEDPHKE